MPTSVAIAALTTALASAAIAAYSGVTWPLWVGPALAAGAPLAFIALHGRSGEGLAQHPLLVSIASGLGCVVVMFAEQRFGAVGPWMLPAAAGSLIVWVLWQRGRRNPAQRT